MIRDMIRKLSGSTSTPQRVVTAEQAGRALAKYRTYSV